MIVGNRINSVQGQQSGSTVITGDGDVRAADLTAGCRAGNRQHVARSEIDGDLHGCAVDVGVVGIRQRQAAIDRDRSAVFGVGLRGASRGDDRRIVDGGDGDGSGQLRGERGRA